MSIDECVGVRSSSLQRAIAAAIGATLVSTAPLHAETVTHDFSDPSGSGYAVTVLNDTLSTLAAGPANGRLEINGGVSAGSEPKVILRPDVTIRAGDSWSVEARFQVVHTLIPLLNTRDSLQTWISVGNVLDTDDDARSKSGVLRGTFDVGGMSVEDGYFLSSGFIFDDDLVSGSGTPTEYSTIDPAAADATATVTTTLRLEYDAVLGELTTLYRLGAGPFIPYALQDGENPAPAVDPQVEWMLDPDDELEIFLMFSGTRAAVMTGESGDITSTFSLSSGDVWFDDLAITGTLVPEPSSALLGLAALATLGFVARSSRGVRRLR